MELTRRLIASVQEQLYLGKCLFGDRIKSYPYYARLERIEAYLILRYARDETPEEREVYGMIWKEIGGEA